MQRWGALNRQCEEGDEAIEILYQQRNIMPLTCFVILTSGPSFLH